MPPTVPDQGQEELTPADVDKIVTKYRTAARIVDEALQHVISLCKPGEDIVTICNQGDAFIENECSQVYVKKGKSEKLRKGVASPTCIVPNELCANLSPFTADSFELKKDDLIKITMGCHIDGYIAVVGHTIVVGAEEIVGRKADVIRAAWTAAEAALRVIGVGKLSTEVANVINKAVEQFNCKTIIGTSSHQIKQHVLDGARSIMHRETVDEKSEPFTFGLNEAYSIDVLVSTGEGKIKESDYKTCVYQRNVDQTYSLKTALARQFLKDVSINYPSLPFTVRSFENQKNCHVGISECVRHELLQPCPVLTEKPNEYIAQFKFTVLLLSGGTRSITGFPPHQDSIIKSSHSVEDPTLLKLLSTVVKTGKKK